MIKVDLTFPLKKTWYYKIRNGEKYIEYRLVKPYWTRRFAKACQTDNFKGYIAPIGDKTLRCILRLGYTKKYMIANINKIEVVDGKNTDLKIDTLVYAIYLNNIHEVEE